MTTWRVALLCTVGCAAGYHLPMTKAQLAAVRDPDALVAYLNQPGADPAVCSASSSGPHVAVDEQVDRALVDALHDGKLAPAIWTACVEQILAGGDRAGQRSLLEAMLAGYPDLLDDPALERDPRVQARLAAVAAAYDKRSPEVHPGAEVISAVMARLHQPGLGRIAQKSAEDMRYALEIEQGRWGGRVVDRAWLDELAGQRDERLLAWFAVRLPDAALRDEARRRVIRLRIAGSPYREVRDDAAHVEEMMIVFGANPISPHLQPPTAARVDPAWLALHDVRVVQNVRTQIARLTDGASSPPRGAAPPAIGIAPLALRGALAIDVTGLALPVSLCGAARDLDPSPCLLPGELVVDSPLGWQDRDGRVHFTDQLTARQAVDLARGTAQLALPLRVAGRPLTELAWPLHFAVPDAFVRAGDAGGDGPALRIEIEERPGRLIYAIDDGGGVRLAVAERADAARFAIVSRGGHGARGSDGRHGSSGSAGSDGSSASCPSSDGGDGGNGGGGGDGGDGSDGGNGGDGGAIAVTVTCDDGVCADLVAALRTAIRSEGGRGGSGGQGGSGGRGGAGGHGGSGTTCTDKNGTTTLSAGSDGSRGRDGSRGSDGRRGAEGEPGAIRFEIRQSPSAAAMR